MLKAKPISPPKDKSGAQIYQTYSRAVVLVISKNLVGSGVVINRSGDIVTNWHVGGTNPEVFILIKPKEEGVQVQARDMIRARVVKVDEVADLALLHIDNLPNDIDPIPLGNAGDVTVGSDVHAIGHPTGKTWTYTKGVVSQSRKGYRWNSSNSQLVHQANVIQTQTPINPGNSGGPLINEKGFLVGINSFMTAGAGLNFAVAVDELSRFLAAPDSRYSPTAKDEQK